jgi:sulfide:quinone oxidoreductase
METEESCRAWKEEFQLEFPVIADEDGLLFRRFTNGWVPWSVLIGPDGRVVFSENEFDESGFAGAIGLMYERPTERTPDARRASNGANCTVVLGGGTGGVVAARELRRRLPSHRRVVVVDHSPDHVFQPSLLWQMVGERRPEQFRRPLSRLQQKGIEFRNADVVGFDLEDTVVATSSGDLAYDELVVALGTALAPEAVAGFAEMAHNLYDVDGCAQIHQALRSFVGGTIGVLVTELPFKCPAAPYEAAFLVESFVRRRGIRRNVEIHLFTPEHMPMPTASARVGDAIADLLAARGIHYHPLFTFKELRPETHEVVASDGQAHVVDLLLAVPPHRAPEVVRSSPLLGLSGFIHVDPHTLETEHDDVYAIGDVATVKLPNGKALPKAGVFAHAEAKVVAARIADRVLGKQPAGSFDGKGYCWVELGDGRASFAGGNFYTDTEPSLTMRRPSRLLHWGKVGFEKWWLHHWL